MPLQGLTVSSDLRISWRIETTRARVWDCLTHETLLGQWLGQLVGGAIGPGAEFVVDHGSGYRCASTVQAYLEPSRLAFTWHFPDEPASAVTIELSQAVDATDLVLTHSGLGKLAASYRDGWCVHLSYLEAAALGTPLPMAMFWRLHATIARLATPPAGAETESEAGQ